jgi:hypothetical protein
MGHVYTDAVLGNWQHWKKVTWNRDELGWITEVIKIEIALQLYVRSTCVQLTTGHVSTTVSQ